MSGNSFFILCVCVCGCGCGCGCGWVCACVCCTSELTALTPSSLPSPPRLIKSNITEISEQMQEIVRSNRPDKQALLDKLSERMQEEQAALQKLNHTRFVTKHMEGQSSTPTLSAPLCGRAAKRAKRVGAR